MARTLKSTGIATNLIYLVMYDDDNTTLKEWVSSDVNSNMSINGATTGTGSWKGTTFGHWLPVSVGSKWLTFASGHRPTLPKPFTLVFLMLDGPASTPGDAGLLTTTEVGDCVRDGNASQVMVLIDGGGASSVTTTAITSQRSYSLGFQCRSDSGNNLAFYGLESGAAATDNTSSNGGTIGATRTVSELGVVVSRGIYAAKYILCAAFNKLLSEAEFQSIHNDPVGTLFEAGGGGGSNAVPKMMLHYS